MQYMCFCYNQGIPVRCTQNSSMERREKGCSSKIKPTLITQFCYRRWTRWIRSNIYCTRGVLVAMLIPIKNLVEESTYSNPATSYIVVDYRVNQINQLSNVDAFLDNTLSPDDVLELGFDHVVTATGSAWQPLLWMKNQHQY